MMGFELNNELTEIEVNVIKLLMLEHSSNEIANMLSLKLLDIDKIRKEIFKKTDCKSMIGLMKYAIRNGIWPDSNTDTNKKF